MDAFDKEFDNSPEAFDDEFESAPEVEKTSLISKLSSKADENLVQPTKSILQKLLESGEGLGVGIAEGALGGGLSELTGAASAGAEQLLDPSKQEQLEAQGFKFPGQPSSFPERYRAEEQATQDLINQTQEESPALSTLGQLGGSVASGIALGNLAGLGTAAKGAKSIKDIASSDGLLKAGLELGKRGGKEYAKALPFILGEGALTSEGGLIGASDEEKQKLLEDVAGSAAFGLPAVMGLQGASDLAGPAVKEGVEKLGKKAGELIEESPAARQMVHAFKKYGQEYGVNPLSEKATLEGIPGIEGGTPFSLLDTKRAEGTIKVIKDADLKLGKAVGSALDNSKATIKADDLYGNFEADLMTKAQQLGAMESDAHMRRFLQNLGGRDFNSMNPREAKNAIEDMSNMIERISSYKLPSPELEEFASSLRGFRRNLDKRLKDTIPEYQQAADNLYQFRKTYLEQPLAGRFKADDIFYANLKKGDQKVTEAYEDLGKFSTSEGSGSEPIRASYAKLGETIKKFEQGEAAKGMAPGSTLGVTGEDFLKQIRDNADDAAVRRAVQRTQEAQGGGKIFLKDALQAGSTGRGALTSAAYYAGKASKPLVRTGKSLYNLPENKLIEVASKLEQVPGAAAYGKALREAIQNGDTYKRNAALFTIMQNPDARVNLSDEDLQHDEED
jgi:hypothetical protein